MLNDEYGSKCPNKEAAQRRYAINASDLLLEQGVELAPPSYHTSAEGDVTWIAEGLQMGVHKDALIRSILFGHFLERSGATDGE